MTATIRHRATGAGAKPADGASCLAPSYSPDIVRGACPSLAAPMQTGDGLLVRLRPSSTSLTIRQFRALAQAASRFGNGLIEITARGSIQIRGLSTETMGGLAEDIHRAGIIPESGLTIETPPLSGRDPSELADARVLAARLRASLPGGLTLAPKLTIVVDGRGVFNLDALSADIRLVATSSDRWEVSVGGTRTEPGIAATGTVEEVLQTFVDLLRALDALGPRARGEDLASAFPRRLRTQDHSGSVIGVHELGANGFLLGITPRYGQIEAGRLLSLLDIANAHGVKELRTGPDHALLFFCVTRDAVERLQIAALSLGFDTDPNGPFRQIASCSGAGACGSAAYRTKDLAAEIVAWMPEMFDGSIAVHLSGCPKGCARARAAAIAIVGMDARYGIVLNSIASTTPTVVVDEIHLKSTLQRLAALVGNSIAAGESVKACLARLGGETIAAVLRQE